MLDDFILLFLPLGLMIVQLTVLITGYVVLTAHVTAIAAGLGSYVTEKCVLEIVLGMENAVWNYQSVSAMSPILVRIHYCNSFLHPSLPARHIAC